MPGSKDQSKELSSVISASRCLSTVTEFSPMWLAGYQPLAITQLCQGICHVLSGGIQRYHIGALYTYHSGYVPDPPATRSCKYGLLGGTSSNKYRGLFSR